MLQKKPIHLNMLSVWLCELYEAAGQLRGYTYLGVYNLVLHICHTSNFEMKIKKMCYPAYNLRSLRQDFGAR